MLFTFRCGEHLVERDFPIGQAPESVLCAAHGLNAPRYFGPESMPEMKFDPFRAFHLSTRKESAQVAQQRNVDAPESAADARDLGKATGRIYIGDDTSGMTKAAQRGIENEKWIKRDKAKKIVAVT